MNLRQMEIVTDVDKLQVDLQATFMKYKTIKQWAYIIHDKDDTRPHYHIYLHFDTSVNTSMVAEWFQVPENFIEKVKGRRSDILLYLIHGNDSQKFKHQYSPSEVHANFDFNTEIALSKILGDFDKYSYAQQLAYVNTLPISEKASAFSKLRKLWELQCQLLSLNTDRTLQVVFVTGSGGVGKTYYAKKLLDGLNLDYCISSSSNDPFQDYMGQKAIILDDLRDKSFEFEDLLKILDNNTSSSVRSRFTNKVFNGDVIVITSSVPLVYWYKSGDKKVAYDELIQLYRRIGSYVTVSETEITVYDGANEFGKPSGIGQVFKNDLADKKHSSRQKIDIKAAFGKICDNADIPEVFSQVDQTKLKI